MNMIDLTYANNYFASRLHADDWTNASSTDQLKAITMANQDVNNLDYDGTKTLAEQDNEFPRNDETTIPKPVKNAICEIALEYLRGEDAVTRLEDYRVKQESFAKSQTTYDTSRVPEHLLNGIISGVAWHLLKPYLRDARNVRLNRVS